MFRAGQHNLLLTESQLTDILWYGKVMAISWGLSFVPGVVQLSQSRAVKKELASFPKVSQLYRREKLAVGRLPPRMKRKLRSGT